MDNTEQKPTLPEGADTSAYETYRVVLEITVDRRRTGSPADWDWHDIVGTDGTRDRMRKIGVDQVPLNTTDVAYMMED